MCFFFFSSRRRHTRLTCDWSSDVCSSDLFTSGIGRDVGNATNSSVAARIAAGVVREGISAAVHGGGRINFVQLAADAFGNALANDLVGQTTGAGEQQASQLASTMQNMPVSMPFVDPETGDHFVFGKPATGSPIDDDEVISNLTQLARENNVAPGAADGIPNPANGIPEPFAPWLASSNDIQVAQVPPWMANG